MSIKLVKTDIGRSNRPLYRKKNKNECLRDTVHAMFYYLSLQFSLRMWFHRPLRADDWLLHVVSLKMSWSHSFVVQLCVKYASVPSQIVSPIAYNARGYVTGQMFNRKGEVMTVVWCQNSHYFSYPKSLCCLICICRHIHCVMNWRCYMFWWQLVVSLTQESLNRPIRPTPAVTSKLWCAVMTSERAQRSWLDEPNSSLGSRFLHQVFQAYRITRLSICHQNALPDMYCNQPWTRNI